MIKKKITRIAFLLLAAVAVFALSFIGARVGLTSSRTVAESDDLSPAAPSIALPGYDEISLKAGRNRKSISIIRKATGALWSFPFYSTGKRSIHPTG